MKFLKSEAFSIGLAMFSMFFGAGNIVYPLAVGQYAGDHNLPAMLGLILTAAIMPFAGVIAIILFDGSYRDFFGRLGKRSGFALAFLTIALLGPLGSTPRCIALAYTTLKSSFLDTSPALFSALACCIIFLFTVSKKHVLSLLGWILTPALLASLIIIIAIGLATPADATVVQDSSSFKMFLHGLSEGYNTMDLLAAFFFSSTIIHILKSRDSLQLSEKNNYLSTALQASIVGACLLAAIYVGFSYIASFHGNNLAINGKDELLAGITLKIAGPYAGLLVCIAIALACLTTAIALASAFTDFMHREVFQSKISYAVVLAGTLLATFFVSTFEFTGISAFLWPVLQIFYPGLIVLTFFNIAYKLTGCSTIKVPVFAAFAIAGILYFFPQLS